MKRFIALLLAISVSLGLIGIVSGAGENDVKKILIVSEKGEITLGGQKLDPSISSVGWAYPLDPTYGSMYVENSVDTSYDTPTFGTVANLEILDEKYWDQLTGTVGTDEYPLVFLAFHKHTPADNWTQTETGHSRLCAVCGLEETPEADHDWIPQHDDSQHWEECSVCHYIKTAKADHKFNDEGVCTGCTYGKEITLTFNIDGKTEQRKSECGQPVNKPEDPTKAGQKFVGWFDDSDAELPAKATLALADKTYTAKWEATGPVVDPIVPPKGEETGGVNKDDFQDNTGGNLTETDKDTIINGSGITAGAEDKNAADKLATDAAKDQKAVDQALADLKKIPGYENLTKDDIEFVAKPVLTIKVEKLDEGNKVVVMDISGMIQVYARTKDGKAEVAVSGKSQALSSKIVTIVVGLPSIFHNEQHVYVGHQDYQYKAANKGSGKFSFINRHGFSDFEFGLQDKAVASNSAYADEFEYLNFKTAASEANSGETLTIKKDCSEDLGLKDGVKVTLADNVKFTGKINGKDVELSAGSVYTVGGSTTDKTGGSGGGSSKPSIKPGTTTTPTDPITNPEDQTGTVAGFSDVAASAWYADAVKYVVDRGLFGGVGNGRFAPDANMTRAMMWTVLARYKGVDTSTGSNWYEAARTWAMQQNISDGTMADGNVTREQFVTMLWRLSGEPAANNSASFTDNGRVSAYAKTAVDWAVAQGIVNGYNDGSFRPQGSATRAEVAKMLMVFCVTSEG